MANVSKSPYPAPDERGQALCAVRKVCLLTSPPTHVPMLSEDNKIVGAALTRLWERTRESVAWPAPMLFPVWRGLYVLCWNVPSPCLRHRETPRRPRHVRKKRQSRPFSAGFFTGGIEAVLVIWRAGGGGGVSQGNFIDLYR